MDKFPFPLPYFAAQCNGVFKCLSAMVTFAPCSMSNFAIGSVSAIRWNKIICRLFHYVHSIVLPLDKARNSGVLPIAFGVLTISSALSLINNSTIFLLPKSYENV